MYTIVTILSSLMLSAAPLHASDTVKAPAADSLQQQEPPAVAAVPIPRQRFKGVPIEGSVQGFTAQLRACGFTKKEQRLEGPFAGTTVQLEMFATPLSATVYAVNAYLPSKPSFEKAVEEYNLYKHNLTAVYGKPSTSIERFDAPYSKGDGFSLRALAEAKVTYMTLWSTDCGTVSCSVVYIRGAAAVMLTYTDATGRDIYTGEREIQIRQDL